MAALVAASFVGGMGLALLVRSSRVSGLPTVIIRSFVTGVVAVEYLLVAMGNDLRYRVGSSVFLD